MITPEMAVRTKLAASHSASAVPWTRDLASVLCVNQVGHGAHVASGASGDGLVGF